MNIDLYTMSGEETFVDKDNSWNITGRTSHLTLLITLTGDIRTDCNLLDPRVLINSFAPLNYPAINYARIRDFDRYYFVRSITAAPEQGRGMFYLDMHVDVLMSYKADIVNVGGIVERSETIKNITENMIPDATLPVRNNRNIILVTPTDQKAPFYKYYRTDLRSIHNITLSVAEAGGSELVTIPEYPDIGGPLVRPNGGTLTGGKQTKVYAMTRVALERLSEMLNTENWFDALLSGVYGVATEALIKSVVFPFDVVGHDPDGTSYPNDELITIAGKTIGTTASNPPRAYKLYPSYSQVFDLGSTYVQPASYSFRNREPYTRYSIYLPYVGWCELSADDILDKTIYFRYIVDMTNGDALAIVHDGSRVLLQQNAKIGLEIPLSSSNAQAVRQTEISAMISAALGVAGALATGGTSAMLAGGAALIHGTQQLVNNNLIMRGSSPPSALSRWLPDRVWMLRTESDFVSVTNWGKTEGHLVMRNIASLASEKGSGLTKIRKAHLDTGFATATYDERQEITSLLESGIIM